MLTYSQDDFEKRKAANKAANEHIDTAYTNNLPNARSSSIKDVSKDIRLARETSEKQE